MIWEQTPQNTLHYQAPLILVQTRDTYARIVQEEYSVLLNKPHHRVVLVGLDGLVRTAPIIGFAPQAARQLLQMEVEACMLNTILVKCPPRLGHGANQ